MSSWPGAGQRDYGDWFEHAPVGYMLLDAEASIDTINHTGAAMLGWEAAWLEGRPFSRWIAHNDKQIFHGHRQRVRDQGEALSPEIRIKNRQGRFLSVRLKTALDSASGRDPAGYRSVLIDMSGEQRAARQLRQLQAQLTHMARVQTAGELAASLAHELNQPLGSVVLNCEAARRLMNAGAPPAGELAEIMAQAAESAAFASDIVRRLRGFLKNERPRHRACELSGLIRDLTTLLGIEARDHDIDFDLDVDPRLAPVRVDAIQIQQVLVNLAHNAIEAMRGHDTGGINRVVIRARGESPGWLVVTVADTGPGLTSAQAEHIFTPFYTTKPNGVGMGLAISRTIVEAHGGALWVESKTKQGAALCFSLPTVACAGDER